MRGLGAAVVACVLSGLLVAGGLLDRTRAAAGETALADSDEEVHRQICSACHPLVSPRSYRREEWPGRVAEMRVLAAERGFRWNDASHAAVLRHLAAHGR